MRVHSVCTMNADLCRVVAIRETKPVELCDELTCHFHSPSPFVVIT